MHSIERDHGLRCHCVLYHWKRLEQGIGCNVDAAASPVQCKPADETEIGPVHVRSRSSETMSTDT